MTRPPLDYAPPEPDMISRDVADLKWQLAWFRGFAVGWSMAVLGGVIGLLIGKAAFGDTISISGTMISLEPSDQPGVVAVVTMENVSLNGPEDNGGYTVAMPGMAVGIQFVWEVGPFGEDQITVIPPPGILCRPDDCSIAVMEGFTGTVALYEFVGF